MIREAEAWQRVPVDDVGYFSSCDLLAMPDDQLLRVVRDMETARFGGWRNWQGNWRRLLYDLEGTPPGSRVFEFGCGLGVEALQYAEAGCRVTVADIHQCSVDVAARVVGLRTGQTPGRVLVSDRDPWFEVEDGTVDVFHASGVIHHIPYAVSLMDRVARAMSPQGSARLMVYSRALWDAAGAADNWDFGRKTDFEGAWADWYDAGRAQARFGESWDVISVEPIDEAGHFLAVRMAAR